MNSTLFLVAELVVLFVGVTLGVELLQRRLGADRLRAWMGGTSVVAALKGIVVGFITPFCTYSAVPLLIGLRRAGGPAAGYVAFIVAAPVLDPVLFGALVIIVGLDVALAYLAIAFTAAKSPLDDAANPASITSTPSSDSAEAMVSFCDMLMEQPGDCSPSRRVVSKIRTCSLIAGAPLSVWLRGSKG